MGNKLVVQVPVFLLLMVLAWNLSRIWVMPGQQTMLPERLSEWFGNSLTQTVASGDSTPHTGVDQVEQIVNSIRVDAGLQPLIRDAGVCLAVSGWRQSRSEDVFAVCPNCRQVAIVKISSQTPSARLDEFLRADASAEELLNNPELTHVCLREIDTMHSIYLMEYQEPSQDAVVVDDEPDFTTSQQRVMTPNQEIMNFSEDELWEALVSYRQSQQRNGLERDEKLCTYARKRVQDHISNLASKNPADYPNPEKYPLDAHAGFAADADSGYAFEVTDKNRLAENLAYWPSATSPVHVIEWGWDTSTEGHRETQLSNDYTHACLAGQQGFYVAIFGR